MKFQMEKWGNPLNYMSSPSIHSVELSGLSESSNILQSSFWAGVKGPFGWKAFSFNLDGTPLLVLVRRMLGKFSIAYIPHGPDLCTEEYTGSKLRELGLKLKKYLPENCFLLRFDLPNGVYQKDPVVFNLKPWLKKALSDIQPPDTVIVSLRESEEEILARMKSKTRYNVRLSIRKGIVVKRAGVEAMDKWYRLYEETSRRDKIAIHSKDYYLKLFDRSINSEKSKTKPEINLFMAVYNGEVLAGIIVSIYGKRATYLYGASSNKHRNLMPAYALQWKAIKYSKEKGCVEYDLFGIPPEDDPDHPMSGLYRFKTGFGGEIFRRPGCWDLPLKPFIYRIYRWAEYLRLVYFKKIRKR